MNWVLVTWIAVGLVGQALFTARFIVQWLASEKRGESVVPTSFWYFSIGGSLLVLSYALWRLDPVFILAYGFNSIVYVRNLMLIHRKRQAAMGG
ncbi:MAG TPA: lipid-A-disaccharide synthase N-terminal domain-containing protein [Planctomycetota bacterium]|nr:lipid-A-disaccharide synthase N-terminal domain-containing protein [Planctomycetota bacterium]HRR81798.1 lipid-A-disaccharide synthase N-terminal domain-containing protein [Planctomycetota bacterium]HRT94059.1 lipid-A-disaccharide synthase N-terminal domain-containing protein [Planctomycetota bacterium]